jgi:hypothetical protein
MPYDIFYIQLSTAIIKLITDAIYYCILITDLIFLKSRFVSKWKLFAIILVFFSILDTLLICGARVFLWPETLSTNVILTKYV